jgi:hypothetical protein
MPTKTTTLFSLETCRAYLEIKGVTNTGDDDLIVQIADGVSGRIEQLTSRKFVTQSVTEKGDARGRDHYLLRYMPVASLTSVKTRAHVSEAWETEDVDDFELDGFTGRVYAKNGNFPSGPLTLEIVASVGYDEQDGPELPSALVQAGLEYLTFVYKRKKAGLIMAGSANAGGASIIVVPEPPKDLRDTIMSFKKYRGIHLG